MANFLDEIFHQPNLADLYAVFSQMHLLLSSGAPLDKALQSIASVQENKILSASLKNIGRGLETGLSTGQAFAREKFFPKVVAPTIEAGDRSGDLANAFFQLSELMWLEHHLDSKVSGALLTPKISLGLMAIMTIGYIKLAVPEFLKIYEDSKIEIPWIVDIATTIVNGALSYWYLTLLGGYLCYKGWKIFRKANSRLVDSWKLKIPIFKKLHFLLLQHQFSSTMNLMLVNGATVPEALVQTERAVNNMIMSDALSQIRKSIISGSTFSESMKRHNQKRIFDSMLIASISAGEQSDGLASVLDIDCKFYERTIANMIDPFTTKVTVLVLIPMGIFIICLYLFSMLPVFSYISQVS